MGLDQVGRFLENGNGNRLRRALLQPLDDVRHRGARLSRAWAASAAA